MTLEINVLILRKYGTMTGLNPDKGKLTAKHLSVLDGLAVWLFGLLVTSF